MTKRSLTAEREASENDFVLSFFSEIRKTEACRGLIFLFVSHADDYENKYRDNIRHHLDELLLLKGKILNVVIRNQQSAEEDRAEDADIRTPNGEDNESDCEPVMQGMGNTVKPLILNIAGMWGIRIVGTFICIRFFEMGLISAWACMIAHNLMLFAVFVFFCVTGRMMPKEKLTK